ncbi:MAG TPA: DNA double-strand break repair nuclease NurA, partial [Candidatus Babeliaceae bacterium]|nr:DNA double-strand break repair nuclease NurA [Candidatus Babeliaceae bacterium]
HSLDVEAVNCRRTELEIRTALEVSKAAQEKNFLEQQVSFIDGSLIFWHLENKEPSVKHRFLTSYLASLQQFYEYALVHCGYISSPKSRDLITLIQYAHHNTQFSLEHIIDSDLVSLFVPIQARTILFKSNSAITSHYPLHLQPFFYYLNTGSEVVRIELPAWIANNSLLVDMLSAITLDQIIKGSGYPVCLCEAHEQAVIKGADRDFFYHAFHQLTVSSTQHRYSYSQKLLKKRGIGI